MPLVSRSLLLFITLSISQLSAAEGIKPCRVDGKLIFTRECMLKQQREEASSAVHQAVEQSVRANRNATESNTPPASQAPRTTTPSTTTQSDSNRQSAKATPSHPENQQPTQPLREENTSPPSTATPSRVAQNATSAAQPATAPEASQPPSFPTQSDQPISNAPQSFSRTVIEEAELAPTLESRKAALKAREAALAAIEASRKARLRALQAQRDAMPLPEAIETPQLALPIPDEATSAGKDSCEPQGLIQATLSNDLNTLRRCHDRSVLKELTDPRGRSLLHLAAKEGSIEALGYLLQLGADTSQRSRIDRGGLAIHVAATNNQPAAVQLLHQSGSGLESRDYLKRTPLMTAVSSSAAEALAMLIRLRADLHATDRSGQSAVQIAAQRSGGNLLLRQLLDSGANPDQADKEGKTALHHAVRHDTPSLRELINHNANLDLKDGDGNTALLAAASDDLHSHRERIRLLIDAGANLNSQNNSGLTLLEIAYREKDELFVQELMKRGVNTRKLARIIERYKAPTLPKDTSYD